MAIRSPRKSPAPPVTVDRFLVWEDGTDRRYELLDGAVVAMVPPSRADGAIVMNIGRHVGGTLAPPCHAVSEAGIRLPHRDDAFYLADVALTCEPAVNDTAYLSEPVVIFEVSSPSTLAYDRGVKIPDYREIPSVREIVALSTTEYRAEVWRRTAEGWSVRTLIGKDAVLPIEAFGLNVRLAELYENIVFTGVRKKAP